MFPLYLKFLRLSCFEKIGYTGWADGSNIKCSPLQTAAYNLRLINHTCSFHLQYNRRHSSHFFCRSHTTKRNLSKNHKHTV